MQVSKFASLPFLQPKILDYINKPHELNNQRIFRKLSKRICIFLIPLAGELDLLITKKKIETCLKKKKHINEYTHYTYIKF